MAPKKPTQVPDAVADEVGTHNESDFNERNRQADEADDSDGGKRPRRRDSDSD